MGITPKQERLFSLVPLGDFKALLGIDDREDALARYCLVTASYTIEEYCRRRLLCRKRTEFLHYSGDPVIPLGDYPVRKILAVYKIGRQGEEPILPGLYRTVPECGPEDIPFCLSVDPAAGLERRVVAIRALYLAGYRQGEVPADLASACLELAAWNMSRFRGKRIGMAGAAVRGKAGVGEYLEASMPENVKALLEPYRRRML
ncbi:conserved hypothetical protein [Treponema primitia ZAS-2]|uniref:Uncharacterized protein n=1 Tax=Treponema primitia (strain ATCC BAA-887 / DSM 12427 / ZAS-2) TaxID=545694 RepID=F5YJ83_TREPZ|nr:hypothetical protein [Treponema primitia]AEF85433.1 conserved hypothetical protein [Treponema primitia ZAS-2]